MAFNCHVISKQLNKLTSDALPEGNLPLLNNLIILAIL